MQLKQHLWWLCCSCFSPGRQASEHTEMGACREHRQGQAGRQQHRLGSTLALSTLPLPSVLPCYEETPQNWWHWDAVSSEVSNK